MSVVVRLLWNCCRSLFGHKSLPRVGRRHKEPQCRIGSLVPAPLHKIHQYGPALDTSRRSNSSASSFLSSQTTQAAGPPPRDSRTRWRWIIQVNYSACLFICTCARSTFGVGGPRVQKTGRRSPGSCPLLCRALKSFICHASSIRGAESRRFANVGSEEKINKLVLCVRSAHCAGRLAHKRGRQTITVNKQIIGLFVVALGGPPPEVVARVDKQEPPLPSPVSVVVALARRYWPTAGLLKFRCSDTENGTSGATIEWKTVQMSRASGQWACQSSSTN